MNGEDWIRRELSALECVECGRAYQTGSINLLARRDGLYFVDLECGACGCRALAVVGIEQESSAPRLRSRRGGRAAAMARRRAQAPPVSADDVLEMHRFLDQFDGDFRGLFGPRPGEARPRNRE
jgi:hypothetical protein